MGKITIKEIKEYFTLLPLPSEKNTYDIWCKDADSVSEYYGTEEYEGNFRLPYLGSFRSEKGKLIWVNTHIDKSKFSDVVIKDIYHLKSLINEFISDCLSYGVIADCCCLMMRNEYRCQSAFNWFMKKYLKSPTSSVDGGWKEVYDFTDFTIDDEVKSGKFNIIITFKGGWCMFKEFDNVLDTLTYIKKFIENYSLTSISNRMCFIDKLNNIKCDVDKMKMIFDGDKVVNVKSDIFNPEQRLLKDVMIEKLEEALKSLKGEI